MAYHFHGITYIIGNASGLIASLHCCAGAYAEYVIKKIGGSYHHHGVASTGGGMAVRMCAWCRNLRCRPTPTAYLQF